VSPILVRPVREQLEHDRVIRLLQARWRRRFDAAINVGDERTAPVKIGQTVMFPDLVLTSTERGHQLMGLVEVETGESVNHLEAMAQWAHFSRARAPFYLVIPAGAVDIARRLCADHQVQVGEIWTYHSIGSQMRFTTVYRSPAAREPAARRPAAPARARPAAAPPRKAASRPGARGSRPKARTGSAAKTAKRK
jgi:hypothetical protein